MAADQILITGATGFVGRHLVRHFLSAGRFLTLAVRDANSCPPAWLKDERIKIVVTGPIETSAKLHDALAGTSTIVHLAGLAHMGRAAGTDDPFITANTIATERLGKAAADYDVRAFIHMSSLAAITPNTSPKIVDDARSELPPTAYGRSKREAEKHVLALADKGIFAVSLRPPLVVGAEAKGSWAALQRLAATGLPLPFAAIDNRRSLICIASLVAAIDLLCTDPWSTEKSGNYCIADAESMSLPDIITQLRHGMGMSPRLFRFPASVLHAIGRTTNRQHLVAGLIGNLQIDSSRFRAAFGFKQPQDLSDAIAESGMRYRGLLPHGHGDTPK